jgi:2-polyprenyl-3-methyl-5-hydroxy-6-metoxy-1,4-benzoquinol methylase
MKVMPTNRTVTEAKWDAIYQKKDFSWVADFLLENSFLLPRQGKALDLASGLGENALFLAGQGLESHAWDISSMALTRLKKKAAQKNLVIAVKHTDIVAAKLPKNEFDVIVVCRFLDRSLSHAIIDCLKPEGLLFYKTYVKEKIAVDGPGNPDFLLDRNELLNIFNPLTVVAYRENSRLGDLTCGDRNEAYFIGQKRH